jgi:hypothetical protein
MDVCIYVYWRICSVLVSLKREKENGNYPSISAYLRAYTSPEAKCKWHLKRV